MGIVEVSNVNVQMELLRVLFARPPGRPVVFDALKRQYGAGVGVQGCKVLAGRPPGIGLIDGAAEEPLVEPCESYWVRTVHDHALQPADHCDPSG
jgi:hypothetical protein